MAQQPSPPSSVSDIAINTQSTPAKVEPPPEFRALTLLDNAPDAKTRPEWQDPVRWCFWGNAAVLVINIALTIAAVGVSASKHDESLGLGVVMTATSSYCCTILMAPSRTDIDKAHSKGTWLSVGVASWQNFRNLKRSSQALWSILLLTSIIMQMIYNSVVYSSLNANAYPVIVAPMEFVSNSSIPTSFYEEQTCWPDDVLTWNITDLRSGIMNGSFEYLSKDECIGAYANSFTSDRRTVVLVTQEPITGAGISLAGYGYAGGIEATNPAKTVLSPFGNIGALDWIFEGPGGMGLNLPARAQFYKVWTPGTCLLEIGHDSPKYTYLNKTHNITWTRKEVEVFTSFVGTNPPPEQMWSYLNTTSWIASAGTLNVSTECTPLNKLANDFDADPLREIKVDHCLSLRTSEECRFFYHLPIALVMIICNLIKVVCIWLLLRIDRHDLILTMGDAISSFLQRPDPTTKQWCTLSPEFIAAEKKCPWHSGNKSFEKEELCSPEPHPGLLPSENYKKRWNTATSGKIWLLTIFILVLYIVISLALPTLAVQNTITHQLITVQPLSAIWQIQGWGTIQSTGLLSNLATSFVGMELLANTPQLAVSFLYFCLNDNLTRMILAADYNNFAIHRRPLRVSFPRGEQRSTWYLTIPYQYAIPILTTFTLIHWFVSEGLFYVQVLPYSIYGKPIPSAELVTCAVSTLPLELGLFLMIGMFIVISFLGSRRLKASKMPIAREWSVAISAACHPPRLDLDAAFKPVQWGVVEDDTDALYPHCSFTSKEAKEPEVNVQYA
ncbi:hypothetical protein N7509_011478 [Penicillium cosmopolitanum]|uniref:DUF6536 domain-containing protein n=1 Tax=Penicillium cosmopolitanum TaxID=1131564 RepID=A0A9W9SII9_9EURO|nr:uncharacterized protein N7509_011478 [Penicillium cosmopolitanum]KAJ5378359.1 hypothetical protein N7509_011478 [Penicillium cosmopolitanum]